MNYFKQFIFSLLLVFSVSSCDLDHLDDPNSITPDTANLNLVLTSCQVDFNNLMDTSFNSISRASMSYTRMQYQFGVYVSGPTTFDNVWDDYYADFLVDNRTLINRAMEDGFSIHAGMGQVLEAYATMTMVDFFGDIPYSEAAQGTDFINPVSDPDDVLYDEMIVLLDNAIQNLSDEDATPVETDLFYEGSVDSWIRLANTIKFKIYLNTKKSSQINALIAENMLINNSNQDFNFLYGESVDAPDSRHPLFSNNYGSGGVGGYMSNSYMYELKSKNDPRLRYYFYRQILSDPSGSDLVCDYLNASPPDTYCYIGDGYWGRDHATTTGIPNDGIRRTAWGVYPVGGKFDKSDYQITSAEDGLKGAGINPIMLSSFVMFLKAEAILTVPGVTGDAGALLEAAVSESISKVMAMGNSLDHGGYKPTSAEITSFIDGIMTEYANATSDEERLEVVMRQFWVAANGNGKEIYDAYRRSGHPVLQTPLELPAIFPRLNLYPSTHISSNDNAVQRQITEQVFWDTNPAGFID